MYRIKDGIVLWIINRYQSLFTCELNLHLICSKKMQIGHWIWCFFRCFWDDNAH